jgi:beta-xylosidase
MGFQDDGKFVLYYSGQVRGWGRHHCVGVAVSKDTSPLGPYVPTDEPLACPRDAGGAIDPAPFRDADDKLYLTYKADGNSAGNGGNCGNGIEPIVDTPIMLQELESDGVTPVGDPVPILHRTDDDGPLVEAPRIVQSQEGIYFLHFSSHCFTSPKYDVKYATSTSLKGPYTRAPEPLVKWGDYGLVAPGGASISSDGTKILFHANCGIYRCTYAGAVTLNQTTISMAKL